MGARCPALGAPATSSHLAQVAALDAGVAAGLGRATPSSRVPFDAPLHGALASALAQLDARARADGHDATMRRAVLALDLPDRPETAPGVAAWVIARDALALVPVSARAGHPLREDADLALVVQCAGAPAHVVGPLVRPPDRSELWPSGCVAHVWEMPLRGGSASPRTAR